MAPSDWSKKGIGNGRLAFLQAKVLQVLWQPRVQERVGATAAAGVSIPYAWSRRWLQRAVLVVSTIGLLSLSFRAHAQGPRQLNRWRDGKNVSFKESRRVARYSARRQQKNRRAARRTQRAAQAQARRQHRATPRQLRQSKL